MGFSVALSTAGAFKGNQWVRIAAWTAAAKNNFVKGIIQRADGSFQVTTPGMYAFYANIVLGAVYQQVSVPAARYAKNPPRSPP